MRKDFTPYEIAYLCGGPERVVIVAVAGLHADGLIRITPKGHRVVATTRTARDPFEAAVFDALPSAGRLLGALISQVSESAAVMALRDALVEENLTGAGLRHPGLRRAQRDLQTRLRTSAAETGPARIAALGSPGITEPALCDIFGPPDPRPFILPHNRSRGFLIVGRPDSLTDRNFPTSRSGNHGGGGCGSGGSCGGDGGCGGCGGCGGE